MRYLKKMLRYLITSSVSFLPGIVQAQGFKDAFGEKSPLGTVAGGAGVDTSRSIAGVSGQVISAALSLVGLAFLLLMVYAGFLWMTARGEEEQVTKAKKIISATLIGLVLILSAYAITVFVTGRLGS